MWTAAHFLDFTTARQSTRFDNLSWDGATLEFDIAGPTAGDDVTVVLPATGLIIVSIGGRLADTGPEPTQPSAAAGT